MFRLTQTDRVAVKMLKQYFKFTDSKITDAVGSSAKEIKDIEDKIALVDIDRCFRFFIIKSLALQSFTAKLEFELSPQKEEFMALKALSPILHGILGREYTKPEELFMLLFNADDTENYERKREPNSTRGNAGTISELQKKALLNLLDVGGVEYESFVKDNFECRNKNYKRIPKIYELSYNDAAEIINHGDSKFRININTYSISDSKISYNAMLYSIGIIIGIAIMIFLWI